MHTEILSLKCNEETYWNINSDLASADLLNINVCIMNLDMFASHHAYQKDISDRMLALDVIGLTYFSVTQVACSLYV
jgi:hypothetical protein